jgi:hypothetical protein
VLTARADDEEDLVLAKSTSSSAAATASVRCCARCAPVSYRYSLDGLGISCQSGPASTSSFRRPARHAVVPALGLGSEALGQRGRRLVAAVRVAVVDEDEDRAQRARRGGEQRGRRRRLVVVAVRALQLTAAARLEGDGRGSGRDAEQDADGDGEGSGETASACTIEGLLPGASPRQPRAPRYAERPSARP